MTTVHDVTITIECDGQQCKFTRSVPTNTPAAAVKLLANTVCQKVGRMRHKVLGPEHAKDPNPPPFGEKKVRGTKTDFWAEQAQTLGITEAEAKRRYYAERIAHVTKHGDAGVKNAVLRTMYKRAVQQGETRPLWQFVVRVYEQRIADVSQC